PVITEAFIALSDQFQQIACEYKDHDPRGIDQL
ncbi:MAG: hypothetical protein RLZZ560_1166, partial [Cyanobacteriota bacterium]